MRRLVSAVCLTLALALAMPAVPRAADTLTINAILSLTGYAAFFGGPEQTGLKVLEDLTNKNGGINGTPIHFEVVDDASNPANALQLGAGLIAKNVPVIIGPSLTSNCESVFPRILESGPLTYCLSPALYPKAGTFGFSIGPSTRDLNVAAVRYFRLKGWKRVALLTTTDASGQDGLLQGHYALSLPENKTMQLVADEKFAITALSIAAQVSHIEAAKPDVILAWVTGTPSGTALRGLHDAGVDVPVLLNAGNINAKQISGYAGFVPKTLLFPGSLFLAPNAVKSPLVREAQRQFNDALKAQNVPPVLSMIYAYDAGRVILDAYRHTGVNATAAQLRDYIERIKSFPGADGMMNFTDGSQRGLSVDGVVMLRWNEAKSDFDPVSGQGGIPAP